MSVFFDENRIVTNYEARSYMLIESHRTGKRHKKTTLYEPRGDPVTE